MKLSYPHSAGISRLLLTLSLFCWSAVDALSVCLPVDSLFIVSSELIQRSGDRIGPFFERLIYSASSEKSGLGVLVFGDVADGFENPLLGLTETIGANTGATNEVISSKLTVAALDAAVDDAMAGSLSLAEAIDSAHQLFEDETFGREFEALFVVDLESEDVDGNADRLEMCAVATREILSNSKGTEAILFIEGLYYLKVDDAMEVLEVFDCFTTKELYFEDKDALQTLYDLTCPSEFEVDGKDRFTLSGKVQLIEFGAFRACEEILAEDGCHAAYRLDSASWIEVNDDSNDHMSYEEGYILMATADTMSYLPDGCSAGVWQIASISVVSEETAAFPDGEEYTNRILRLQVISPERDIFSYLRSAHTPSADGEESVPYMKPGRAFDQNAIQEARKVAIHERRRRMLSTSRDELFAERRRLFNLFQEIGKAFEPVVETVAPVVEVVWEPVAQTATAVVGAAEDFGDDVVEVAEGVVDGVERIAADAVEWVETAWEDISEWADSVLNCIDVSIFDVELSLDLAFDFPCDENGCTIRHTQELQQYWWYEVETEIDSDKKRRQKSKVKKQAASKAEAADEQKWYEKEETWKPWAQMEVGDAAVHMTAEAELQMKLEMYFTFSVETFGPEFSSSLAITNLGARLHGSLGFTFTIAASVNGSIDFEWEGVRKHLTKKPFITWLSVVPVVWWPQMGMGFEGSLENVLAMEANYQYEWDADWEIGARIQNNEVVPISGFTQKEASTDNPFSTDALLAEIAKIEIAPACPYQMPFRIGFPISLGVEFYLFVYPHLTFTPALEGDLYVLFEGCSKYSCSGWPSGVLIDSDLDLSVGMGIAGGFLLEGLSCLFDDDVDLTFSVDLFSLQVGIPDVQSCEPEDESINLEQVTMVNHYRSDLNSMNGDNNGWIEAGTGYYDHNNWVEAQSPKWYERHLANGVNYYMFQYRSDDFNGWWVLSDTEYIVTWCDDSVKLEDCRAGQWWYFDSESGQYRSDPDAFVVIGPSLPIPHQLILVRQYWADMDGAWSQTGSIWNGKPVYTKKADDGVDYFLKYEQGDDWNDGWFIGYDHDSDGIKGTAVWTYGWCQKSNPAECGQGTWWHFDDWRGTWSHDDDAYAVIGDSDFESPHAIELRSLYWYEYNGQWHDTGMMYFGERVYSRSAYDTMNWLYRWRDDEYDGWTIENWSGVETAWCDAPALEDCVAGQWWFVDADGVWHNDPTGTIRRDSVNEGYVPVVMAGVGDWNWECNGEWVPDESLSYNDQTVYTRWAWGANQYLFYESGDWNVAHDHDNDGWYGSWMEYYGWCGQTALKDCVQGTWWFTNSTLQWEKQPDALVLMYSAALSASSRSNAASNLKKPTPGFHSNSGGAEAVATEDTDDGGPADRDRPLLVGSAIGAAVMVVVVIAGVVLFTVKRRKTTPQDSEIEMDGVAHVPDDSADGVVANSKAVDGVDGATAKETATADGK